MRRANVENGTPMVAPAPRHEPRATCAVDWLSADGVTPRCAAARAKLPFATMPSRCGSGEERRRRARQSGLCTQGRGLAMVDSLVGSCNLLISYAILNTTAHGTGME